MIDVQLHWSPSCVTILSARLKLSHKRGGPSSGAYLYYNMRPSARLWQSHKRRNCSADKLHNKGTTVSKPAASETTQHLSLAFKSETLSTINSELSDQTPPGFWSDACAVYHYFSLMHVLHAINSVYCMTTVCSDMYCMFWCVSSIWCWQ